MAVRRLLRRVSSIAIDTPMLAVSRRSYPPDSDGHHKSAASCLDVRYGYIAFISWPTMKPLRRIIGDAALNRPCCTLAGASSDFGISSVFHGSSSATWGMWAHRRRASRPMKPRHFSADGRVDVLILNQPTTGHRIAHVISKSPPLHVSLGAPRRFPRWADCSRHGSLERHLDEVATSCESHRKSVANEEPMPLHWPATPCFICSSCRRLEMEIIRRAAAPRPATSFSSAAGLRDGHVASLVTRRRTSGDERRDRRAKQLFVVSPMMSSRKREDWPALPPVSAGGAPLALVRRNVERAARPCRNNESYGDDSGSSSWRKRVCAE